MSETQGGVDLRVFCSGGTARISAQLEDVTGARPESVLPAAPAAGDVLFLDIAAHDGVPFGNAFSACRSFKKVPGVRVYLLVPEADAFSAEIARFCLADGCLQVAGADGLADVEGVRQRLQPHRPRVQISPLLAELERKLRSDEGRARSVIQQMLAADRQAWILEHLTDAGTGLFAGPFASFKLDEEFKRAYRFHQPLSLILLDIGDSDAVLPATDELRRACLAEVAAVLLNECRDIDTLARFTETTFVMLLPGTGADGAGLLTRRILRELAERPLQSREPLVPRAGVVTVPAAGIEHRQQLLARAEACLRLAQQGAGSDGQYLFAD